MAEPADTPTPTDSPVSAETVQILEEAKAEFEHVWVELSDSRPLERERAIKTVSSLLMKYKLQKTALTKWLLGKVESLSKKSNWESRQSAFLVARAMTLYKYDSSTFRSLSEMAKSHLEDEEPRVRLAVAELIEVLGQSNGTLIWTSFQQDVLAIIEENFVREENPALLNLEDRELQTIKKTPLMHDTEGWKALETAVQTLYKMISGIGKPFCANMTPYLIELVLSFLSHKNRFVREIGFRICASLALLLEPPALASIGEALVPKLADGLLDDWSQVAYAAAGAVRAFMNRSRAFHEKYFPTILPVMCFSRHNVADGVKQFSQESWRLIMDIRGKGLVAKNIEDVVRFYIKTVQQDHNTPHQEAACYAIMELATKVDPDAVRSFAAELVEAVMLRMQRTNPWPVVDAAMAATAAFITAFPLEIEHLAPALCDLMHEGTGHIVWSVRENAAIGLSNLTKAYPPLLQQVLHLVEDSLQNIQNQKPDSHINPAVEQHFGPDAKLSRDNDPVLHTGQDILSCECHSNNHQPACSLFVDPSNSHDDHSHNHREDEPWQYSDGAVFLLRELAINNPVAIKPLLQYLANVALAPPTFAHHHNLQETIWRQLPHILKALTKPEATEALEMFLQPLLRATGSNNQLVRSAALECLQRLADIVGKENFASVVHPAFLKSTAASQLGK